MTKLEIEEMVAKDIGTELGVFELMKEKDPVKRFFIGLILDHEFISDTMSNHIYDINDREVEALQSSSSSVPFKITYWSQEVSAGYRCMNVLLNWIKKGRIKTVEFESFSEKGKDLFARNELNVLRYFDLVQREYTSERVVSRDPKWKHWMEQIRNTEFN